MPLAYGLIHPVTLPLPNLPLSLEGLRLAHVTDLHVRPSSSKLAQLVNQLTSLRLDLVLFTGDHQHDAPNRERTLEFMQRLTARLHPALGCYGVFGNHDDEAFADAAEPLPVRWLRNERVVVEGKPIELFGLHHTNTRAPDAVELALRLGRDAAERDAKGDAPPRDRPLRVMLCHDPEFALSARAFGVDVVLSGHTHGGQVRLPWGRSLINACGLPQWMSSGLIRDGSGPLWCVSRGVGESGPPVRLWCPPHVPVYTLRRRTGTSRGGEDFYKVMAW